MTNQMTKTNRWTIADVLQWTAEYFRDKGIQSGRLDAEVLLAHALNVDRLYLYMNLDRPLLPAEREMYRSLVRRRGRREPVALIVGTKEFWSIPIHTSPGILIPRPETEILVEVILEEIAGRDSPAILEIGTGSGAVAVAVARERPAARILATDVDPDALSTAAGNAKRAGVLESLTFLASDLFSAIRPDSRFDVICSNPPYVPSQIIRTLEPEIVGFEPHRALDGGPDGLDVIRCLVSEAKNFLAPEGALILEIGEDQEAPARQIMSTGGLFRTIKVFRDLAGKPRVVKGK